MIAVNESIPNIPKLEMVKVLPSQSEGCNFLSFAFLANSFTETLISSKESPSAKRSTGTSNPSSTATAIPIFTWWFSRMTSPNQLLFTLGCCFKARATALTIKSLKLILTGAVSFTTVLAAMVASMLIFMVR